MPAGRIPKLPDRKVHGCKQTDRKPPAERKLSTASLRKLARAHTEAALQVLAEVATKGNSEASRIAAAMALLDRGYGKSGSGMAGEGEARAPILYHRIELIDGTKKDRAAGYQGADNQAGDDQD